MSPITTHVLDTTLGRPAAGMAVSLYHLDGVGMGAAIADGTTDADGRITDLLSERELTTGIYRLSFDTAGYFAGLETATFYPRIDICFEIRQPTDHYHVPLLLSPFGYTTYRGS